MLCLFSALSLVSAASVSIEGNTLWIARSLPVSTYDILLAKVASHSLACGVPTLIGAIICAVALGPDLIGLLALFITPIALVVTMGFAGVAINLRFPRLDWVNPVQPVKQGASILIAMLAGAALIIAPGMLYVFLLNRIMDVGFMIFLTGVVYIGISILLAMSLKDKGARLFEELGG
jgi:ABC-2 type transport system permease protein